MPQFRLLFIDQLLQGIAKLAGGRCRIDTQQVVKLGTKRTKCQKRVTQSKGEGKKEKVLFKGCVVVHRHDRK